MHSHNGMYIDLFLSINHLHVSHIFLHKMITIFVPSSPATFISSYCIYDRNLAFHYSESLKSICAVGTDIRSVLIIAVKINSKGKLVEDREGESVLYGCNWLW